MNGAFTQLFANAFPMAPPHHLPKPPSKEVAQIIGILIKTDVSDFMPLEVMS